LPMERVYINQTALNSYLLMELYSGLYLNMGGPIPDFYLSLMAWYAGAFSLTTVRKLEVSRFNDYYRSFQIHLFLLMMLFLIYRNYS
jgi:hypothetical protein